MPNPYVNKVELTTGETLIDISDTTAVASDVAAGKYFYGANGEKLEGSVDYLSKVRAITFVVNRGPGSTTSALIFTVYGTTFGSAIDFSNGIKSDPYRITINKNVMTASVTLYVPKSRPIIAIGNSDTLYNFDVTMDSAYGTCIDAPDALGASNPKYIKVIYLNASAPDQFTITIDMRNGEPFPDTVFLEPLSIVSNGTYTAPAGTAYTPITVDVPQGEAVLQAKTGITPTESSQTITPDTGYDGLSSVEVEAISSTYVGSGITRRSASDVTQGQVAGEYQVSAPAGYYESSVTKYVPAGTSGTPTATKGTVSNHQVSVTPSVTNSVGYILGGTKTGTPVTVTAAELASGNKAIADNGTNIDVVGYSTVSVAVPFSTIYTGSTDPSSSQGVNGDIYLKLS